MKRLPLWSSRRACSSSRMRRSGSAWPEVMEEVIAATL